MTSKKHNSIKRRTNKRHSKISGSLKQQRSKKTIKRRLIGGGELLYGGTLDLVDGFKTTYNTTFFSMKFSHNDTKSHTNNIKLCAAKLNEIYKTTLTNPRAIDQDKRTKLLTILNKCFTSSDPNFELKEAHIWSDITPNNKIVDNYVTGIHEKKPYEFDSLSDRPSIFTNLRLLSNCINVTRLDYETVFNTEVNYNNENELANAFKSLLKHAENAHSNFIKCYKSLRRNFDEQYYELPLGRYSGWSKNGTDLFLYFFGDFKINNLKFNSKEVDLIIKNSLSDNSDSEKNIIEKLFTKFNKESIMETFLENFNIHQSNVLKVLYKVKKYWGTMKILENSKWQNAEGNTFKQFYKSIYDISEGLDHVLYSSLSPVFKFHRNLFKINQNKNILNGTELNESEDPDKQKEYKEYYEANKNIIDKCISEMNKEIHNYLKANCNRILVYIAMFYEHVCLEQIKEYNSYIYSLESQWLENFFSDTYLSINRSTWLKYKIQKFDNIKFNREILDKIVWDNLNGEQVEQTQLNPS